MPRQPQPPIPVPLREQARRSMSGLTILAVMVAVGALVRWQTSGNARGFLLVVPVLLLVAATALRPGVLAGTLILAASTVAGWVFDRPVVGAIVGVAVLGYGYARTRGLPADLQPAALQIAPATAVGVGAEGFVEEFTTLGYRQVGALTTPVGGFPLIITIMLGPSGERYAAVTDAVVSITSTFGFRSLVTRNSASSLLAPEALDNPVVGAEPAQLDAAHTSALALVAPHLPVDSLDPAETTARAMAAEVRDITWLRAQPSHLRRGGNRRAVDLASDPARDQLIADWLGAPDPAEGLP